MMILGAGLCVFPEILIRSKCFYGEAKFQAKAKKKNPKVNFHTSAEYEES